MAQVKALNHRFTIRLKETGEVVARTDSGDITVEEICPICERQGVIYRLHDQFEPHKGNANYETSSLCNIGVLV